LIDRDLGVHAEIEDVDDINYVMAERFRPAGTDPIGQHVTLA
jgi:hypothetical protein